VDTPGTREDILVSSNVVSLFTKVPIGTLKLPGRQCNENMGIFHRILTYFRSSGHFCEQNSAAAGSLLSLVRANFIMEDFEEGGLSCLQTLLLVLLYRDECYGLSPWIRKAGGFLGLSEKHKSQYLVHHREENKQPSPFPEKPLAEQMAHWIVQYIEGQPTRTNVCIPSCTTV
jgi:hypothetical protein